MPDAPEPWVLVNFVERLDLWIETESPSDDLRRLVTAWIFTRIDDPYQGVRREPGFANLWFGPIPGSEHGEWAVVCCSYWIEEQAHRVVCDTFTTLTRPL
ncbi:hypothetical protein [Protofrankia sp. BMG5.30]|uniref:hypothetical protein n=1 Tax=Protofrankia sp. BMG5.30 TaxID=1834514 RepID=UPI0009769CD8|nr:hypothetical protein [Protofrankia sp. BMG5.30]ONH35677.1 hypothetical protein BL254_10310 [Protofrankia sp. BMG5.30]